MVVTAASGRVGLWRRADRTLAPLGRAAAPQTLVAAGAGLGFAHATAARGSRDVSLWRRGGASEADSSETTTPAPPPASLTHPSPVTHARWREPRVGDDPDLDAALVTVAADGAARVWIAAPAAFRGGAAKNEEPARARRRG